MRLVLPLLLLLILLLGQGAGAEASECYGRVQAAALKLQPWYAGSTDSRTLSLRLRHLDDVTRAICAASAETGIDPVLAVAVARRESSLLPLVGLGTKNGSRGERGYFQILPNGAAERFSPDACSQHDPYCNASTALRYMAFLQNRCGSTDPWVWVGAYGSDHCPTAVESRSWRVVQLARSFYCDIADCSSLWPE